MVQALIAFVTGLLSLFFMSDFSNICLSLKMDRHVFANVRFPLAPDKGFHLLSIISEIKTKLSKQNINKTIQTRWPHNIQFSKDKKIAVLIILQLQKKRLLVLVFPNKPQSHVYQRTRKADNMIAHMKKILICCYHCIDVFKQEKPTSQKLFLLVF